MRKRKTAPQGNNQDALLGEIQRLRQQVHQLQLERDIPTKANELFICFLDRYIRWYNEERIKLSLGAMSPVKYRQHLGITT